MQDGNTTYLHKKRAYIIINHLLVGLVHQLFFLFFLRRGSVRLGKLEEEERVWLCRGWWCMGRNKSSTRSTGYRNSWCSKCALLQKPIGFCKLEFIHVFAYSHHCPWFVCEMWFISTKMTSPSSPSPGNYFFLVIVYNKLKQRFFEIIWSLSKGF